MLRYSAFHIKTFFLAVFAPVAFGVQLPAQDRLVGTVVTPDGAPLPYANVLLLSAADSSLVKGQVSGEEGTYGLDGLPAGEYVVAINLIGYAAFHFPPLILDGTPGTREMGTQAMRENSTLLSEVEIVLPDELYRTTTSSLRSPLQRNHTGRPGLWITSSTRCACGYLRRSPSYSSALAAISCLPSQP